MARGNNGQRIFLKRDYDEAFLEAVWYRSRALSVSPLCLRLDVQSLPFTLRGRGHSHGSHHAILAYSLKQRRYNLRPLCRNLLTPQALFPIARQSLESRFDRTFLPFFFRRSLSLQIPLPRKNR